MKRCVSVIGGDRRQAELAQLLAAEGYEVCTCGLEQWKPETPVSLETAAQAEAVILPLPLCRGEGVLNCAEQPLPTRELFRKFRPEQRILAGQVQPQQHREAALCGLTVEDYFLREEVTVANAALTAEAALQVAMERLERSLLGMDCLVLGFGRIGKLLCHRLQGMGARVSAAARKSQDLAWIRAYGWEALDINRLEQHAANFGLLFNTVPAPVAQESLLRLLPKDCLCVDLASAPGIDPSAAERLGMVHLRARSLPGQLKPHTAAKILCGAINDILLEG